MENSPELNGKYLGEITGDFAKVSNTLKEGAYQIKIRKISDYPIFPISKSDLQIGQKLLGKEEVGTDWNFNISYLDEFLQRKLVDAEKLDAFKEAYKDPDEFCCLFVVDKDFVNFIFIPYPED
ncbi:hypothetical protein [Flexithrix dorotheae]|uniref:hypothetical protein n=1 Tax=Flexithrix dorotheae TaxID=70993 RepID=UPI00036E9284|nr:hypothetical protein [Flexithrix dorotheae]